MSEEVLNAPAPEATPPAPDPAPAPPAPSTSADTGTPYLKIDDRTVYRTPEDAIKGWNDLKSHASTSAAFKDVAASYGVTDPKQVEALFQELLEHRERASKQATPASTAPSDATLAAAKAGDRLAYESLDADWKAHVDRLNKLGYVTEDKLKPLQDRLDRYDQQFQQNEQAHLAAARTDGETILNSIIEREKFPADDGDRLRIANAIQDEIVGSSRDAQGNIIPGSAEDRFIRGTSAERASMIETGFRWFISLGDKYATSKQASYVAAKTNAQANQPRTLPQGSSPSTGSARMGDDERTAAVKALLLAHR